MVLQDFALLAQEDPELYRYTLDRHLMVYVLAGTGLLVLMVIALQALCVRRFGSGLVPGNIGIVELVIGLSVVGALCSLALPSFIDPSVVTTVVGTLIGSLFGARLGRTNRDQSSVEESPPPVERV